MGIYIYGISKRMNHPQHGRIGVLKYLFKPCGNWDQNDKWDRQYCNFVRARWKKDPVRIVCFEGYPQTLYLYKGGDGIWQDHREDLLIPLSEAGPSS